MHAFLAPLLDSIEEQRYRTRFDQSNNFVEVSFIRRYVFLSIRPFRAPEPRIIAGVFFFLFVA